MMKETLLKIRERLSDQLDYLAQKSSLEKAVYIISADNRIPRITGFPAITLKDGPIDYTLAGGTFAVGGEFQADLTVKVTVFVKLWREEDILTGNDAEKGILDIAGDVLTALTGYNPDETDGSPLFIIREGESYIFEDDDGTELVQGKDLVFRTFKQVSI